ncbi:MAG: hypothetical protein NVSMB9_28150 [Isosphaeraceae bacterium]
MGVRDLLFLGLVLGGASLVGVSLYPPRAEAKKHVLPRQALASQDNRETVRRLDASFRKQWSREGIRPAAPASELAVLRRLALALTGSIPSLEELRKLETIPRGQHASRYLEALLGDRRFADYFAERMARTFGGTEDGPFLIFRRRRFVSWLSDQIAQKQPYDQIVRELIATDGLWTNRPATNFLTVTTDAEKDRISPERLAGRVCRAFLGIRLDCAQCHDHPFSSWKQTDFQGLAAFFGQVQNGLTGIHDTTGDFQPTDRKSGKPVTVAPRVPFLTELLPSEGKESRRQRLARWVTHPRNPHLSRSTVNRVWALMFGRPLVDPVDDISTTEELPEALTILAEDFVAHGFDLRRLVRTIAATEAFHLDSALPVEIDSETFESAEKSWALFPMTRLRPEQVVGAVSQAASLKTLDADSPILVRLPRFFSEQSFVQRYGDSGEDEFDHRGGTIPQRLLMMNGELVRESTKPGIFNAGNRISYFAPSDQAAVEVAYVTALTRQPTAEESRHFEAKLAGSRGDDRAAKMSDLFWVLINSTEFSWNH